MLRLVDGAKSSNCDAQFPAPLLCVDVGAELAANSIKFMEVAPDQLIVFKVDKPGGLSLKIYNCKITESSEERSSAVADCAPLMAPPMSLNGDLDVGAFDATVGRDGSIFVKVDQQLLVCGGASVRCQPMNNRLTVGPLTPEGFKLYPFELLFSVRGCLGQFRLSETGFDYPSCIAVTPIDEDLSDYSIEYPFFLISPTRGWLAQWLPSLRCKRESFARRIMSNEGACGEVSITQLEK
jgi:hypothetical protein